MFKLQSSSKYYPFAVIHLSRCFFLLLKTVFLIIILLLFNYSCLHSPLHSPHPSKQFLNLSILMPFSMSAIFYSTSSASAKCFPLRTFFI